MKKSIIFVIALFAISISSFAYTLSLSRESGSASVSKDNIWKKSISINADAWSHDQSHFPEYDIKVRPNPYEILARWNKKDDQHREGYCVSDGGYFTFSTYYWKVEIYVNADLNYNNPPVGYSHVHATASW